MTSQPSDAPTRRGVVRLLNTAAGRVLCLAGEIDPAAVELFLRRYGREPVRVEGIDAGSVTALSAAGLELVLDHLDAAGRSGRPVALCGSPEVERLLAGGAHRGSGQRSPSRSRAVGGACGERLGT